MYHRLLKTTSYLLQYATSSMIHSPAEGHPGKVHTVFEKWPRFLGVGKMITACTRKCSMWITSCSVTSLPIEIYWPIISTSEFRFSSAMWHRSGFGEKRGDWLVRATLSRVWTIAWRRQEIHCCLLKESLAWRLWDCALERPLLLTLKQFFTEGWRQEKGGEWNLCKLFY